MIRRQNTKSRRKVTPQGFTLIEMLIIVLVIGILSALAAPSLGGMLDSAKVNQTVSDLRVSLQETQRQAIRKNKPCTFTVSQNSEHKEKNKNKKNKTSIESDCLPSGTPDIAEAVEVATNLGSTTSTSNRQPQNGTLSINFGALGGADFTVKSTAKPPNLPSDPSGKIVAFIPEKDHIPKKCVAISSTLGLTRIGTYTGSTDPQGITDQGVCTALSWQEQ